MDIVVVIPAYNEAKRIGAVLERMPASVGDSPVRVVVVDDGSHDDTAKAAKAYPAVKVVRHKSNLGKGAAAKTGCDAACKMGADIIVLMDADGQHRPEDIARLAEPLLYTRRKEDPPQALVIGTRERNAKMPMTMRFGNAVMNGLAKALFDIRARDTQSGFRAFSADAYPKIRWAATNYAMETEMLILAAFHRIPIAEVTVPTIYLDNYKGTTVVDGLRILKTLIKWKLLWFQEYRSLESFSA